jgi:hypothetical protein
MTTTHQPANILQGWVSTFYVNYAGRKLGPYHARTWKANNKVHRQYIKPADLDRVRAACQANRELRQRGVQIAADFYNTVGNLKWLAKMANRLRKGNLRPEDYAHVERIESEGYATPGRTKLRRGVNLFRPQCQTPNTQNPFLGLLRPQYTDASQSAPLRSLRLCVKSGPAQHRIPNTQYPLLDPFRPQYQTPNTQNLGEGAFMYPHSTNLNWCHPEKRACPEGRRGPESRDLTGNPSRVEDSARCSDQTRNPSAPDHLPFTTYHVPSPTTKLPTSFWKALKSDVNRVFCARFAKETTEEKWARWREELASAPPPRPLPKPPVPNDISVEKIDGFAEQLCARMEQALAKNAEAPNWREQPTEAPKYTGPKVSDMTASDPRHPNYPGPNPRPYEPPRPASAPQAASTQDSSSIPHPSSLNSNPARPPHSSFIPQPSSFISPQHPTPNTQRAFADELRRFTEDI